MSDVSITVNVVLSAIVIIGIIVLFIKAMPIASGERAGSKEFDALFAESETLVREISASHINDAVLQHNFDFFKERINILINKAHIESNGKDIKLIYCQSTTDSLRWCVQGLRDIKKQLR